MSKKTLVLLILFSLFSFLTPKAQAATCTTIKNNLVITKSTTLCAGTYTIADTDNNGIIQVKAANITIDGSNLVLNGSNFSGYGVVDNGYSHVTIQHMTISNYYYGMRFDNATYISLQNNTVWKNKGETTGFLNINQPLASAYGGGILFNTVSYSTVKSNTLTNQDTGVDVYFGTRNTISNNNGSNNTAWGIRLYGSTYNTISTNQLHNVNRCDNSGCDSAGLLLVYGANNNTITGNNLTYSGDGFFIGNEAGLPSINNTVTSNDGSYSSNNAFEATFSSGNVFTSNTANNSNYGFWLGFSHDTKVQNNTIKNNRTDGIAWESGRNGTISGNQLIGNVGNGISLTLSTNTGLIARYPGSEASHNYTITSNTIQDNGNRGVNLSFTTDSTLTSNKVSGNQINIYSEDDTSAPTTTPSTFGNSTVGSSMGTFGDPKVMSKSILSKDATVSSMMFYGRWDGSGATRNKGFIYTDVNGTPTALKAVSNILNVDSTTPQWWTITFPNPVSLKAGTYWLGILMEEPGTYVTYDPGVGDNTAIDRTGEDFTTGPEDPASPVFFESERITIYVPISSGVTPTPTPTPQTFVSSNNKINKNNILCTSTTGKTCQFNAYNNSGKSVDMTNNWWGTTNTSQISSLIWDNSDDPTRGPLYFTPVLTRALTL